MTWDWSHVGASSSERLAAKRRGRHSLWASWLDAVGYLLACGILAVAVYIFFTYRIGFILTSSMAPTLKPGDQYLINLRAYRRHPPQRGDIIVFQPRGEDAPLVKRVIGLPGETVTVLEGRVYINGQPLYEPYLAEEPIAEWPLQVVVPERSVFVLGDNRNFSEDSRDLGPVSYDEILGRAERIIQPSSRRRKLP